MGPLASGPHAAAAAAEEPRCRWRMDGRAGSHALWLAQETFNSNGGGDEELVLSAADGARAPDGLHSAGAAAAGADEDLTKEITWFHSFRRLTSWTFWSS